MKKLILSATIILVGLSVQAGISGEPSIINSVIINSVVQDEYK
ncbi:MAG: hypothetical protein ABI793_17100 [Flavobacterium sp.]